MADAPATQATPVYRRRGTLELLALDPALELGVGGEARVLALPGDDTLVAKLYHQPTIAKARKLALMMATPPALEAGVAALAWPCDLLLEERGRFAGFLMPRVEGPRLFEFYNPTSRRQVAPLCHYGMLHRAGANIAAAFEALHAAGYVVGDVNESNVLIGAKGVVTLVDCDSMQVRDPDGAVHRSHVGKAEFTPPELVGRAFADFDRAPEHDRFGLAALLFLLLMEGTHPFASRLAAGGETPPVEERIRRGLFPFGGAHPECRPPRLAPRFELLGPELQALFARAFVDGHADPAARPAAAEWRQALLAEEGRLVRCAANRWHRHGAHLQACPWCERKEQLRGRDPFPGRAAAPALALADPMDDAEEMRATPFGIVLGSRPKPVVRRPVRAPLVPHRPAVPAPAPAAQRPLPAASPPLSGIIPPSPPAWLADLPAPMRAVLGPRALGNPLPWLAALMWVMLAGEQGQALALLAFFIIFARMVLRGLGDVGWETAAAAVGLVFGAALLTSGMYAAGAEPYDTIVYDTTLYLPAQDPAAPAAPAGTPQAWFGAPYALEAVDAVPELLNADQAQEWLVDAYPSALRDAGVTGGLTLNVWVRADGSVDPATVTAFQSSHPEFADAARSVASELRFRPLTSDGAPREAWVVLEVFFSL